MTNEFSGGLETLKVWKMARSFRSTINDLVNSFTEEERYLLRYHLLKSSRSVGNVIAKGYGCHRLEDMIYSCRIARGHLLETLDNLYIALDEKYISAQTFHLLEKEYDHLLKLLNGYIGYLKKKEEIEGDDLNLFMEEGVEYGKGELKVNDEIYGYL
jgi:four helix bundle protein